MLIDIICLTCWDGETTPPFKWCFQSVPIVVSTHVRDLFGEVLRFNQMQYMIVMLPLPITLDTRRFVVVKDDFWLTIYTPDAIFDFQGGQEHPVTSNSGIGPIESA